MAGRRPKPASVHRRNGTFRKDRHGKGAEAPSGRPAEPSDLPLKALEIWRQLADRLEALGTLQPVHGAALTMTAQALEELRRLDVLVSEHGEMYKSKGMLRPNPAVAMRASAWNRAMRGLVELGLTPASQSKVPPASGQDAQDPALRYLG